MLWLHQTFGQHLNAAGWEVEAGAEKDSGRLRRRELFDL